MFWKKKPLKLPKDPLHLDYDSDRRKSFRVYPGSETPVVFSYENRTEPLHNLSAGGMAFFSSIRLEVDRVMEGDLFLPQALTPIPVVCRVLEVEETGMVRASIESISDTDQDKIHQYVLDRQKQEMAAPAESEPHS